jgi:DNA repair exonuclease SbcCD nuclease subunit
MFRFIHTADLHLDAPLRSLALRNPALFERVGAATRAALARIVGLCLQHEVQALMIAGDLFDGSLRSIKSAAFLNGQMEKLHAAGIQVFIIRGNHDAENRLLGELQLPPNVHVFSAKGGSIPLNTHNVTVHGASFAKPHAEDSLLPLYPDPVPGHYNIGLLHSSLAGAPGHDPYAPCRVADLVDFGYDYWCLGHIHSRQVHAENPFVVMPGMPQGRHIGEEGEKSVTLVCVDNGAVSLEVCKTSVVDFARLRCDVGGVSDWRDLQEQLRRRMLELRPDVGGQRILRLELYGQTTLGWVIRRDLDLLTAQMQEAAETIGNLWVEKITSQVSQPEQAAQGENAQVALQEIMSGLQAQPALQEKALAYLQGMVDDLPVELRNSFGKNEAETSQVALDLMREGSDEIIARMLTERRQ